MYKVGLEKAEEPKIKLPTFIGSWRKEGSFRKISISALLTIIKKPDSVDQKKLWETLYNKNVPFPSEIFPTYLVHSEASVPISTLPVPPPIN